MQTIIIFFKPAPKYNKHERHNSESDSATSFDGVSPHVGRRTEPSANLPKPQKKAPLILKLKAPLKFRQDTVSSDNCHLTSEQKHRFNKFKDRIDTLYSLTRSKDTKSNPSESDVRIREILNEMENAGIPFLEEFKHNFSMAQIVVRWKSPEAKKFLEKHRAELVDRKQNLNNTLLHDAAAYGHIETVKYLVNDIGYDINVKHNYDVTPLHGAAGNNDSYIVEFLCKKGADVHARDEGGCTALHYVCTRHTNAENGAKYPKHYNPDLNSTENSIKIIRILLAHGADPEAKSNHGATPLHYAASRYGGLGVVQELIGSGAEKNASDNNGENVYHYAVKSGCVDVGDTIDGLLKLGINAHLANKEGHTALDVANRIGVAKRCPAICIRLEKDMLERS